MTAPKTEPTQAPETERGGARRRKRALIALAVVVVLLGVVVGWLWWQDHQNQESETARTVALQAAKDRTVAVMSYDFQSVDQDLRRARAGLTAPFLQQFDRAALVVAPTARQRQIATHARVTSAAVVEAHPDDVVVLLFVNQDSRSVQSPDVQLTNTRVQVTMHKVGDQWLISRFAWV